MNLRISFFVTYTVTCIICYAGDSTIVSNRYIILGNTFSSHVNQPIISVKSGSNWDSVRNMYSVMLGRPNPGLTLGFRFSKENSIVQYLSDLLYSYNKFKGTNNYINPIDFHRETSIFSYSIHNFLLSFGVNRKFNLARCTIKVGGQFYLNYQLRPTIKPNENSSFNSHVPRQISSGGAGCLSFAPKLLKNKLEFQYSYLFDFQPQYWISYHNENFPNAKSRFNTQFKVHSLCLVIKI